MSSIKYIATLIVYLFLTVFSLNTIAQTKDFIPDGVFTSGIEGPAVDKSGNVYAVNYKEEGTIGFVDKNGNHQLFIKLSGGSIGNGIRFDKKGMMYIADYTNHNILKLDPVTKIISIYAHNNDMNQPNDIAISVSGVIYASDPSWKNNNGKLWKIGIDGNATLLEENMGTTNGIEISANEKFLYVNESVQRKIWRYTIDKKTGNIKNKKLFMHFDNHGLDGMRCDIKGNIYVTRYGAGEVVIINPKGKIIKTIVLKGKKPSNIAFGGPNGKTVYVTVQDRGAIEIFDAEFAGREWFFWKK